MGEGRKRDALGHDEELGAVPLGLRVSLEEFFYGRELLELDEDGALEGGEHKHHDESFSATHLELLRIVPPHAHDVRRAVLLEILLQLLLQRRRLLAKAFLEVSRQFLSLTERETRHALRRYSSPSRCYPPA